MTITIMPAVDATGAANVDFVIPVAAKWARLSFSLLRPSAGGPFGLLLGTGGVPSATGYAGSVSRRNNASAAWSVSALVNSAAASGDRYHGGVIITLLDAPTFTYSIAGEVGLSGQTGNLNMGGAKSLTGLMNLLRLPAPSGTWGSGTVGCAYFTP